MAIKKLDPTATFRVICDLDDALITETEEEVAALREKGDITRHEHYLTDLDESRLKFEEGKKPNRFIIRCLRNDEWASLQTKHMEFDSVRKQFRVRDNQKYLFDLFEAGCLGLENDEGVAEKVTYNEVGLGVVISVGAAVSLFTLGGKHLKKP